MKKRIFTHHIFLIWNSMRLICLDSMMMPAKESTSTTASAIILALLKRKSKEKLVENNLEIRNR